MLMPDDNLSLRVSDTKINSLCVKENVGFLAIHHLLSLKDLRYQYPLEEHVRENSAEDTRCLAMAEEVIEASQAR